jgi:hypothetical protein
MVCSEFVLIEGLVCRFPRDIITPSQVKRLDELRIMSRHSKAIDQRCSESNGLPKDEDSKLTREEEKRKECRQQKHISLAVTAFRYVSHIPML